MAPAQLEQRRAHNLLLISKLLNQRDASSPFTLVIDSLEQSAKSLIREYIRRAKISKSKVVFVSYETLKPPEGIDLFIQATRKPFTSLQKEIAAAGSEGKTLLIFDTLNWIAGDSSLNLPSFLSSLISLNTSLLAVYHQDIPLSRPRESAHSPHSLTLLRYLSTAIFSTHSLHQVLAKKAARGRSLAEPVFGLAEEVEGIVQGLGSNDSRGVVLEMEYRRKSGRSVHEWFLLPSLAHSNGVAQVSKGKEIAILLDDHPLYRQNLASEIETATEADGMDSTFNLGLTEKQRRDREGVVLPYIDAQKGEGGEGGRILYDMGEEDDFDEEEDEV
jgi:elongator complex protein 5